MAGKFEGTFNLAEIATDAGSHGGPFDQPCHFLIVQALWANGLALSGDAAEERAMGKPGKGDPGFDGDHRAGGFGAAAADFDLAPSGLAA
ncbi:hypothetical protein RvVAR0630_pl06970 (plasmid) [Agrobacterium vitis]|nr:hypothetical protein RvVAR0630_pl06970 [Agrobacterium vitis]